ncbi:hypothetical protein D1AOALGA4SA_6662 [Olavius algarvensis Delta 1 endosymbiont]|nr:hypothetical protein D1AOALGA4SA_6662 [Olavius algarvensis Delta 1 endosymbiont]
MLEYWAWWNGIYFLYGTEHSSNIRPSSVFDPQYSIIPPFHCSIWGLR